MKNTANYNELLPLLTGRNNDRRKLANNTYLERRPENRLAVKLHQTDVVTFYPEGRIVLNSGGWKTPTTKDRIVNFSPVQICQKNGVWTVYLGESSAIFKDGMSVYNGRLCDGQPASELEADKVLRKQIREYCSALVKALPLPSPGAGDCFYCGMREVESRSPLGEYSGNADHLRSHMEEKYFVPALVWRALEFAGCKPNGGGCAWFEVAFGNLNIGSKANIGRYVKKYLYRQFKLA